MGKLNSSLTRVVPLFNHLYQADVTGLSWLPKLLQLPTAGNPLLLPSNCRFRIVEHCWGEGEKSLDPPVALLSWLIRHPRPPENGGLSSDPSKCKKRREWLESSTERIREGVALLRSNPTAEDWHIFEGKSCPDAYIETDDLIVVLEGKRTEHGPTTGTKWMKVRHEMLRHIDGAWEEKGNKHVVGFFIVEGKGGSVEIPPEWLKFSASTIAPNALLSSLPHRGAVEQRDIASCFIGVTTWQRACEEFRINCESLEGWLNEYH